MNRPTQHSQVEELLPAAALEILDREELGQVEVHARECEECARLLEQYREVAAAIALGLPHRPPGMGRASEMRERLLARAGRTPPGHRSKSAPPVRSRWGGVPAWTGWGVAAGLAGALLVHHGFHRPLAYGWIVAGILALVLVGLGGYSIMQRRRAVELEERLARLERDRTARHP